MTSSYTNHLPKATLDTIALGIGASTYEFEGNTNIPPRALAFVLQLCFVLPPFRDQSLTNCPSARGEADRVWRGWQQPQHGQRH